MEFTRETVEHIAKLAKLEFEDHKYAAFEKDFKKIMEHFDNLSGVELEDVDINDLEGKKSVLRSDDVHLFEDTDALVQNVKKMQGRYIEIPKVVE